MLQYMMVSVLMHSFIKHKKRHRLKGPKLTQMLFILLGKKALYTTYSATCQSMNKRRAMFQTFKSSTRIFQSDTNVSHVVSGPWK